jgi:hypothetical protein
MTIHIIKKLDLSQLTPEANEANDITIIVAKLNEIIEVVNEHLYNVKPSLQEPKVNKGYENEPVIGDPNDRN